MNRDKALAVVINELMRATKQNGKFSSAHEAWAVLYEEVDELWDEVKCNNGYHPRAAEEAKQVAAMAIRYLMDFGEEDWYDEEGNRIHTD